MLTSMSISMSAMSEYKSYFVFQHCIKWKCQSSLTNVGKTLILSKNQLFKHFCVKISNFMKLWNVPRCRYRLWSNYRGVFDPVSRGNFVLKFTSFRRLIKSASLQNDRMRKDCGKVCRSKNHLESSSLKGSTSRNQIKYATFCVEFWRTLGF